MGNKYLNKLRGQLVVLIGGTGGIGVGIAEACIEFGAAVVVASSKQENVDKAVQQLQAINPDAKDRISGHVVDLASPDVEDSLTKLFEFATDGGKRKANHVVETSGDGVPQIPLKDVTPETLEARNRIRYTGSVMIAKVASKYLDPSFNSSFTMTTGALVYKPMKGRSLVTGPGGAKEGLSRGLAVELAPIRVNLVSPGTIHTGLLENSAPMMGVSVEEALKRFASSNLLQRNGTVEDMAEIYLALMKSGFITGTVTHVEGGFLLK